MFGNKTEKYEQQNAVGNTVFLNVSKLSSKGL
jgi:hypothetical protein